MQTPDITPAQVLAVITGIIAQLVTAGFVDGRTEQLVVGLAGIVVPFAWIIADAVIRHGRATGNTDR